MVEAGLVDYAAMDIKNSRAKYAEACGLDKPDVAKIEQSAAFLMEGRIPYEFRTTVVRELHSFADFEAIGRWLDGARAYYLQSYVDSEDVLVPGFTAYGKDELETFPRAAGATLRVVRHPRRLSDSSVCTKAAPLLQQHVQTAKTRHFSKI